MELWKAPSVLQGAETRIPKDVATPSSYICRVNDFSRVVFQRCFRELAVCRVSRNISRTNRPRHASLLLPLPPTGCSCFHQGRSLKALCHSPFSYSPVYIHIESCRSVLIFVLYLVGIFRCKARCLNRNSNRLSRLIQFHLNSPFNSRSQSRGLKSVRPPSCRLTRVCKYYRSIISNLNCESSPFSLLWSITQSRSVGFAFIYVVRRVSRFFVPHPSRVSTRNRNSWTNLGLDWRVTAHTVIGEITGPEVRLRSYLSSLIHLPRSCKSCSHYPRATTLRDCISNEGLLLTLFSLPLLFRYSGPVPFFLHPFPLRLSVADREENVYPWTKVCPRFFNFHFSRDRGSNRRAFIY